MHQYYQQSNRHSSNIGSFLMTSLSISYDVFTIHIYGSALLGAQQRLAYLFILKFGIYSYFKLCLKEERRLLSNCTSSSYSRTMSNVYPLQHQIDCTIILVCVVNTINIVAPTSSTLLETQQKTNITHCWLWVPYVLPKFLPLLSHYYDVQHITCFQKIYFVLLNHKLYYNTTSHRYLELILQLIKEAL